MIVKWRKSLDESKANGAMLASLSEAFHCLAHDLIITMLYAYEANISSLRLIDSKNLQIIKVNDVYSAWSEIIIAVLQGCVLGPLLFNIFIGDNHLKVNPGKYHVPLSEKFDTQVKVRNVWVPKTSCEKPSQVKTDNLFWTPCRASL